MAILRVNATRDGALVIPGTAAPWHLALGEALSGLRPDAPVCVLIHGYRYTWRDTGDRPHCPQDKLYRTTAVAPTRHRRPWVADWPARLGFGDADGDGLCIAFGWEARRNPLQALALLHRNDFALVYDAAAVAGRALAPVLGRLAEARPGTRTDFLTHSLGARVALQAMAARPDLALGRAILLGAAEYAGEARRVVALQAAAGGGADVYHVLSRANDVYDALFQMLAPRPAIAGDRPLGIAGIDGAARWLDIQLDHPAVADWLRGRAHRLERMREAVSHWHFYADAGAMRVWRDVLHARPAWSHERLRAQGFPEVCDPRWSRLAPLRRLSPFPARGAPAGALPQT